MAIISSPLLLRSLAVLHLTAAYYLLTDPAALPDLNLVVILGGSMSLPPASAASFPSHRSTASTALAALFLAYVAVSDLVATGLPEFGYDEYWSAQVTTRLLCLFGLVGWLYAAGKVDQGDVMMLGREEDGIKNSLVFTAAFVELLVMFWVFLKLREERRELAIRVKEKQARG